MFKQIHKRNHQVKKNKLIKLFKALHYRVININKIRLKGINKNVIVEFSKFNYF